MYCCFLGLLSSSFHGYKWFVSSFIQTSVLHHFLPRRRIGGKCKKCERGFGNWMKFTGRVRNHEYSSYRALCCVEGDVLLSNTTQCSFVAWLILSVGVQSWCTQHVRTVEFEVCRLHNCQVGVLLFLLVSTVKLWHLPQCSVFGVFFLIEHISVHTLYALWSCALKPLKALACGSQSWPQNCAFSW